jgi:hypothetical protein
VQQSKKSLREQNTEVKNELNSHNFADLLDYTKIGSKHQKLLNSLNNCPAVTARERSSSRFFF